MKNNVIQKNDLKVEFEPLVIGAPDKLCVGVFGRPGTGKTRLMATAPRLAVIPLQRKTRPTVEQVLRDLYPGRTVMWPKDAESLYKYENPMALAMMQKEESKTFHRELLDRVKRACWSLLEHKGVDTIGIDSGYTLYEIVLAAHYGKSRRFIASAEQKVAYGPPNDEFRELLTSLSAKHLIVTTEAKEAYVGIKPQGFDEPSGYKNLGYDTNVLIETKFTITDGFFWNVKMCQDRAELQGTVGERLLSGEMCEFKYLAKELRPDSEIEDWE